MENSRWETNKNSVIVLFVNQRYIAYVTKFTSVHGSGSLPVLGCPKDSYEQTHALLTHQQQEPILRNSLVHFQKPVFTSGLNQTYASRSGTLHGENVVTRCSSLTPGIAGGSGLKMNRSFITTLWPRLAQKNKPPLLWGSPEPTGTAGWGEEGAAAPCGVGRHRGKPSPPSPLRWVPPTAGARAQAPLQLWLCWCAVPPAAPASYTHRHRLVQTSPQARSEQKLRFSL